MYETSEIKEEHSTVLVSFPQLGRNHLELRIVSLGQYLEEPKGGSFRGCIEDLRFESRNDLERRDSDEYEIRFEEGSFDGLVQCDGIDRSRVSLHVLIQRVECVGFRLLGEVLTHRIVPNLLNGVDA